MAKRWASSRMRWTRWSAGLPRLSQTDFDSPGRKISSSRLASPTTGNWPNSPSSRSTSTAMPSWPLPPSMITRSGRLRKPSSARALLPGSGVVVRFDQPAEAPAQHLAHTGEVVRFALAALAVNLEALVGALERDAAAKDDHRADGVGALEGADVETFDPHGRLVQAERALQVGDGLGLAVGVGVPLGLLQAEILGGVVARQSP